MYRATEKQQHKFQRFDTSKIFKTFYKQAESM